MACKQHVPNIQLHCTAEVLLACRWHLFGGNNIEARLSRAFESFDVWRRTMQCNTSLTKFELATFKMTSLLDSL